MVRDTARYRERVGQPKRAWELTDIY